MRWLWIGFFGGVLVGYVWRALRDHAIVTDTLEAMRFQARAHEREKQEWLRCLIPPLPVSDPDVPGDAPG